MHEQVGVTVPGELEQNDLNSNNLKLPLLPNLFVEEEFNTETFKIDKIIKIVLVAPVQHRVQASLEQLDGDQGVEEGPDGQGDLPPVVAGEDDDPNLEESEMDES